MNKNLEKAVRIVKKGGIIIFPTDTAFGIGCRIDNKAAVQRLFEIRKRSMDKAVPILVSSTKMAQGYVKSIPEEVLSLMKRYWPGGLTIILECNEQKVQVLIRGGGSKLGIRMPDHDEIITLIKDVGVPILGPSANFSGKPAPYKLRELDPELMNLVDFVLEGKTKEKYLPSTVIDCTEKPWKILREGAIKVNF